MHSKSNPQPEPDSALHVFGRQHGLATDGQLRRVGVTWEHQRTKLRRGEWERIAPGVLGVAGSPDVWHQHAMCAVLRSGDHAMICGAPAARLHRLDGFADVSTVEILLPHGRHREARHPAVRWSRRVGVVDRHVIEGIPVTILPLTLIHLAASGLDVEKALDSALRQRFSPAWFEQTLTRWSGTPGAAAVERFLAERHGKRLPRSWFQRLARRLFEADGIALEDEWPVRDGRGRLVAEIDLAHIELKVGVECQSVEWHTTSTDRARDTQRRRRLRQLGWEIVEVWWGDLARMDEVIADVRLALAHARRLTGS